MYTFIENVNFNCHAEAIRLADWRHKFSLYFRVTQVVICIFAVTMTTAGCIQDRGSRTRGEGKRGQTLVIALSEYNFLSADEANPSTDTRLSLVHFRR